MEKSITKYKIINGTDDSIEFIFSDQIKSQKKVEDKNGNTHVIVNWYDDEFCIDSTFVCDELVEVERMKFI